MSTCQLNEDKASSSIGKHSEAPANLLTVGIESKVWSVCRFGVCVCVCQNACLCAAACMHSVCDRRKIWYTLSALSSAHNQEALNRVRRSLQGSQGRHINRAAANKKRACWRLTQEPVALKTPLTKMPGEWKKEKKLPGLHGPAESVFVLWASNCFLLF